MPEETAGMGALFEGAAASEDMQEVVRGRVSHVSFSSPGFSAGRLDVPGGREVSFAGKLMVRVNDAVVLMGKYEEHARWGRQFKVERFQIDTKVAGEGLARYLAGHPDIHGLGPVKARVVAERFGDRFDAVVDEGFARLLEVPGITEPIARSIVKVWRENRELNKARLWLLDHGLSYKQAETLIGRYRNGVVALLQEDPYLLAREVEGFGFKRADEIAQKVGLPADHPSRLQSAVTHALFDVLGDGSTWAPYPDLVGKTMGLLDLSAAARGAVENTVDALVMRGKLVGRETRGGLYAVGLPHVYKAEIEVAEKLAQVGVSPHFPDPAEARALVAADVRLNVSQKNACMAALCRNLAVVTGGAGTGKTFTMGAIAGFYEGNGRKVLLAAPTGKAAKRMEQLSGREAMTLHRMLGYMPSGKYRLDWIGSEESFAYLAANPLPWFVDPDTGMLANVDAVLVDESSMIDVFLARELLRAVDLSRTAVVFFGDHHQLPPVGPGNFLRDVVSRRPIPVVLLDLVVRQAGALKENATAILKGKVATNVPPRPAPLPQSVPVTDPDLDAPDGAVVDGMRRSGSRWVPDKSQRSSVLQETPWVIANQFSDEKKCLEYLVNLVTDRLQSKLGFSPDEVQLVVPTHKGTIGAENLNRAIQAVVQQSRYGVRAPPSAGSRPRPLCGDRVIQTKNNYALGVMNGAIGLVRQRRQSSENKTVVWDVEFEDGIVLYPDESFGELQLAYALTVHKSQGSEWPCVVFVAHKSQRFMHSRNLFYTAVTRAQKTMVIVGDPVGIQSCAEKDAVDSRRTWLQIAVEMGGSR